VQLATFRRFLQLAIDVEKPVVIHSRDAEEDTISLIEESGLRHGVLHCFTGSRAMAEAALDLGFHLSFSGIVTFKNGAELLAIAADTPKDRLLVETDAPFLAPIPFRGKTNEPAYVRHTAQRIAEARGESLESLAHQTFHNACAFYGWGPDR
jgi:TatD DNase family protein